MNRIIRNKGVRAVLVALALIATPAVASAASFNSAQNDLSTVAVQNATLNPNSNIGWGPSTTAVGGQMVTVEIYYHNAGTDAAQNTILKMNVPTTAGTSMTVGGSVTASNASTASGSGVINFTDGQGHTLTFSGTMRWYPDQLSLRNNTPRLLLNGQTGLELFNQGLNVGIVPIDNPSAASGQAWNYSQGTLDVDFIVSQAQTQATCPASATTNPATNMTQNGASFSGSASPTPSNAYLSWFEVSTNSAFNPLITSTSQRSTSVSSFSDSTAGLPAGTFYYLRAAVRSTDAGCSQNIIYGNTQTFTTLANQQQAVISVVTNPATGVTQTSGTLQGSVTVTSGNATNISRWFEYGTTQNYGSQTNPQSGTGTFFSTISTTPNTTYYFRAMGSSNETGTVPGNPMTFTTPAQQVITTVVCPSNVTTQYPTGITQTSANFSGTVNQPTGSYLTWFEYGINGSFGPTTVQQTNPGTTFYASTYNLSSGSYYAVRAVVRSLDANCSQTNNYGNPVYFNTPASYTYTYTPPVYYTPPAQVTLLVTTNQATNVGTTAATLNGFTTASNANNVTRWFEWGTTYSLGQQTAQAYGAGTMVQDVYTLTPNTTYYFRAVARSNETGTVYGQILTFQTVGQVVQTFIQQPILQPSVYTNPASNVTSNSARFNANAIMNNVQTNGWFEWGMTPALGRQTAQLNLGASPSNTYFTTVTGLTQQTLYYFRAVTQNVQGQIARGQILTFTTPRTVVAYVPPTVYVPPKTVVTVAAATYTKVTSGEVITKTVDDISFPCGTKIYVCAREGHTIQYTITVMNPSYSATSNAVITDTLAPFLDFKSASEDGNYNPATRLVQWSRQLGPREGHTYMIQVLARNIADNIVVTNNAEINVGGKMYKSNDTQVCITIAPIRITITADKANVSLGDTITYAIRYTNVDGAPVQNLTLRMSIPQGTTLAGSNQPNLQTQGGIVMIPLGGLNPKQDGTVTVTLKVDPKANADAPIVFATTASFQDTQGVPQQEVTTYVSTPISKTGSTVLNSASVVGAASSTSGFLPTSLLGWLAFLLLILIIVLIIMRIASDYGSKRHPPETV